MRTPRSPRLTLEASEQLLDGGGGHPPLSTLLAAATRPGTARETAGETAATAAFVAARLGRSLSERPSEIPSKSRTLLSKLLAAKALAVVVLTASATGGVAFAASSSTAPEPAPSHSSSSDRPASFRGDTGRADPSESRSTPERPSGDKGVGPSDTAASPNPSEIGLCRARLAGATDNGGRAGENPAFQATEDCAGAPDPASSARGGKAPAGAPRSTAPDDHGAQGAGSDAERRGNAGGRSAHSPMSPDDVPAGHGPD